MLRPQKFEFDARDQISDADCSFYSVLHPLSSALHPPFPVFRSQPSSHCPLPSALEVRSTCPNTSPTPRPPHATPEFSLHASGHRLGTDTDMPTPSTSPRPVARGDPLFASSNHYLVFFRLCLGSGLKKLAFAKTKNLSPADSLFILIPNANDPPSYPIFNILYPINHLYPNLKKPPQQSALLSKKFYPGKRGKMPILGP